MIDVSEYNDVVTVVGSEDTAGLSDKHKLIALGFGGTSEHAYSIKVYGVKRVYEFKYISMHDKVDDGWEIVRIDGYQDVLIRREKIKNEEGK